MLFVFWIDVELYSFVPIVFVISFLFTNCVILNWNHSFQCAPHIFFFLIFWLFIASEVNIANNKVFPNLFLYVIQWFNIFNCALISSFNLRVPSLPLMLICFCIFVYLYMNNFKQFKLSAHMFFMYSSYSYLLNFSSYWNSWWIYVVFLSVG